MRSLACTDTKDPPHIGAGDLTYRKSRSGVMYLVKTLVLILERINADAVFSYLKVEMVAV